jgi:hypothetical protein
MFHIVAQLSPDANDPQEQLTLTWRDSGQKGERNGMTQQWKIQLEGNEHSSDSSEMYVGITDPGSR